jgi:hypothetical protein
VGTSQRAPANQSKSRCEITPKNKITLMLTSKHYGGRGPQVCINQDVSWIQPCHIQQQDLDRQVPAAPTEAAGQRRSTPAESCLATHFRVRRAVAFGHTL